MDCFTIELLTIGKLRTEVQPGLSCHSPCICAHVVCDNCSWLASQPSVPGHGLCSCHLLGHALALAALPWVVGVDYEGFAWDLWCDWGTGRVWVVREAEVQYACGMFGVCYVWCGGVLRLYGVNVVWGIHVLWGGWVYGVYM